MGTPPSEIPVDGDYDHATLAADIADLIRQLSNGQQVRLIGQDCAAVVAYAVIAGFPELIERAVVMAVPHPGAVATSILDPRHVHHSFHWWFFQLPGLPEQALAAKNFAFIDYLWRYWSAPGHEDVAHIADIKRMLAEPGALTATLGYYRAMFDPGKADPHLETLRQSMNRPISVPTLALCAGVDPRAELMRAQAQYFTGEYRFEIVPGAGQFLHREQPAEVNRLILEWLASASGQRVPHT